VPQQYSDYVRQLDHVVQQQHTDKLKVCECQQLDAVADPYALAKD